MKKLVLLLIFFIDINAQQKILTLNESLNIGLGESKDIKIAQSILNQSNYEVAEYGGYLLPKVSFAASYTRLSNIDPFKISVPFSPIPIKIQDAILDNYNFKLSLKQPLFTGFKLSSLKNAATDKFNANKYELSIEKNKTALNIITAYYNYYKAIKLLKVAEDNVTKLKEHYNNTKVFVDNGLATINDLLKIEVQYNNAELNKINFINNKEIAKANFNKAINLNLNANTEIDTTEINIEEPKIDYEKDLAYALSERAELKSIEYKINAADNYVTAATSNFYPSIYLIGNYYYNRPNQRLMPLKDEFKDSWDLSLSLTWDIWDWGINSALAEQSKEAKNQTILKQNILKENITQEVYSNYLKVISEYTKIKVAKFALISAQENFRISEEKYLQQLLTSTDLLDAETNLTEAKINLVNTLVDYQLALTAYKKSLGFKLY